MFCVNVTRDWPTTVADLFPTVCVTEVMRLCSALSCDEFCEVARTSSGVSEARCVCTVGFTQVPVTESRRCDSEFSLLVVLVLPLNSFI